LLPTIVSINRISSLLFLSIAVLTVANALSHHVIFTHAAVASVVLFLILEFSRIPPTHKKVGIILLVGGGIAAAVHGTFFETIYSGLQRTLPFLLLFASVAWLQVPSSQSPSLLAVREAVLRQPPGRRFASVVSAAHFLGVSFNLAGLALLTPMVRQGIEINLQRRLGRAMIQGFAAGTCWSPFYVGTAFILTAVPGVDWVAVGLPGLAIAFILMIWSWLFDRLFSQPAVVPAETDHATEQSTLPHAAILQTFLILASLFAAVIALVEGQDLSIPIALSIVAPLFALVWAFLIHHSGAGSSITDMAKSVLFSYPGLRGEAMLFSGANILGVAAASLIPKSLTDSWAETISAYPNLTLFVLIMCYGLASAAGIHPVVSVVLITTIITPEMIGFPPEIIALAFMAIWGQGTNTSPFSATVLYMARVTGADGWTIAWRWNGLFVASTMVLIYCIIIALNTLDIY
jgi:hypothetical protein